MSQNTRDMDENVSGTVYTAALDDALESIDSSQSGSTAPTIDLVEGKLWFDTSTNPGILKIYDQSTWKNIGLYVHPNHSGDVTSAADGAQTIAAGAVTLAKQADMAEATVQGRAAGAGTGAVTALTPAQVRAFVGEAWPVGSIFIATVSTNPATLLGYGTWVAHAAGRVLVGYGNSNTTNSQFWSEGEEHGYEKHKLVLSETPSHRHSFSYRQRQLSGSSTKISDNKSSGDTEYTDYQGGNGYHNNVQPSIGVYMWNRTA